MKPYPLTVNLIIFKHTFSIHSLCVLAPSNTVVFNIHIIAIYRVHTVLLGIFVERINHDEHHAVVFAKHVGYPNQRGELYIML